MGNTVLLLETNMNASHGGQSDRFNRLKDTTLEYSFILMQMIIKNICLILMFSNYFNALYNNYYKANKTIFIIY